uniref:Single-strand DNA deaminase toxin A-like C-terminal domain-containing protein n=1 Tax=Phytophthora ramorum TaxID=164328 RepID=H3GVI6_PHYRM
MTTPPAETAASSPRYFSFKDFLPEEEATAFFELPHAEQVVKVTQYLDFLGQQPNAAQFTTSSKAAISFATLRDCADDVVDDDNSANDENVLKKLLEGRTRSGFGAFGTEQGFLPQKRLSLAVAHIVEQIAHTYIVERNKRGDVKPPVLNSRSFFFYWCHAEKQKLMDIREKLAAEELSPRRRQLYWQHIVIVVDRAMCDDCIRFAECFARFEETCICMQDPVVLRVFPPSSTQQVRCILVSDLEGSAPTSPSSQSNETSH